MLINHNIPPVYDEKSEILILGSFPSVRSREAHFFYSHKQNRFWNVLSAVLSQPCPETAEDKKLFLLSCRIALWDVVASCEITGSADSTLKDAVPNDISPILALCPDIRIFTNGTCAKRLYDKLILPRSGKEAILLPSTSPANAAYSLERLTEIWRDKLG